MATKKKCGSFFTVDKWQNYQTMEGLLDMPEMEIFVTLIWFMYPRCRNVIALSMATIWDRTTVSPAAVAKWIAWLSPGLIFYFLKFFITEKLRYEPAELMVEASPKKVFANAHTYHVNSIRWVSVL